MTRAELPRALSSLPPRAREALSHSTRRHVLRTLDRSEKPLSQFEIAAALRPRPVLSTVGYHLRVLEACGCIGCSDARPGGDALTPFYVSTIAAEQPLVALLRATEDLDRAHRKDGPRPS